MEFRDVALVFTAAGSLIAIIWPIVEKVWFDTREHNRKVGAELTARLVECLESIDQEAEDRSVQYRDLMRASEGHAPAGSFEAFSWSRKIEAQTLVILAMFEAADIDAFDFQKQVNDYLAISSKKLVKNGHSSPDEISVARASLAASAANLFSTIRKKYGT